MPTPAQIILDTDMLTDCDDAGALAMLHALADLGEAKILGVAVNGIDSHGLHGSVVSAINYYFGRPNIPIGMTPRTADKTPVKASTFAPAVYENYLHDGLRDSERPNAVDFYRQLLTEAEDNSITIVSIGFLSNIADLLAEEFGRDLLARKVRSITIMGGNYPAGSEYNFISSGSGPTTKAALENWPKTVPMTFIGLELGQHILTGTCYANAPDSPMRRTYELAFNSINVDRPSWDQIALLHGVRGLHHDGRTWFKAVHGRNCIEQTGSNNWQPDEAAIDAYLELAVASSDLATVIEQLMTAPPSA